jgi:orotate phosphoribosyltransferase
MLSENEILEEFTKAQAILKGHFVLSSGLHSDTYLQCARVMMQPARAKKLCAALAQKLQAFLAQNNLEIDLVVAPAMGGVVVGYEIGCQLGLETIFCERVDGEFQLRRGFEIAKNARVLLVEDVITTGKSSLEAMRCVQAHGAKIVAEASLINRGEQEGILPCPLISLLNLDVASFDADNVPVHLRDIPAIKPGSRWLKS